MVSNGGGDVAHSEDLRRTITRRRLMALWAGAAATLVVASCVDDREARPEIDRVEVPGGQIPEPGGEPFHSEQGRFYLVNDQRAGLMAIYTRCTHQGCTVEWKNGDQEFACPCHGSRFDRLGIRTDGPAERPLELMAVERRPGGGVRVDTTAITKRSQ
jgi:nitrite reductase/ring-hydroxylating ferredoxin subunit